MVFESALIWYIRFIEIFSLIIASILVTLAYRGYRKSNSKALLLAAVGFGILGVGSLFEGLSFEVFGFDLREAHGFRSTFSAVGLLVLLYSIYKTR